MKVFRVLFCGLLLATSCLGQNVAPEPKDLDGKGFGEDEKEYWNTEYDRDKMQLLVKRMQYTMFSVLYYFNMAQIVMLTFNIMAIIPLTIILIVLTTRTQRVIKRREAFLENPERLKKEIDDKISKTAAKQMEKRDKKKKEIMKRAAKRAQEMTKLFRHRKAPKQ